MLDCGFKSESARGLKLTVRVLAGLFLASFGSVTLPATASAKDWRGAEMVSWQTFRYGAFEARIRAAPGGGVITPFFLIKDKSWEDHQEWEEIDFEIFGRLGATHFQTQIITPANLKGEHIKEYDAQLDLSREFHTYRIEWTPAQISFYFDGYLVRSETDQTEFNKYFNPNRVEAMRLRTSVWAGDTHWSGAFDPHAAPTQSFVTAISYERYTPRSGPNGSDFTREWTEDFTSFDYSRWYLANWDFGYAVNEYSPNNGQVLDHTLVLSFTSTNSQGYYGSVPRDDSSRRGPEPRPVDAPQSGDGRRN